MGATRVKKKARGNVEKSRVKSRKVDTTPEPPSPAVAAPVPQPHGGALIPGKGRGPAPGAPNAGRPPDAFRAKMRLLLAEDGIDTAREMLRGEPDKQGRVPDHDLRLRLLSKLTEIGFNERMRTAKLEAEAAAAATTGSKAQAGVQLILQGGPAGNLLPDGTAK